MRWSGASRALFAALVTSACGAGLGAGPASALTYNGTSRQSNTVRLETNSDGTVARFRIGWTARCHRRGASFSEGTQVRPLASSADGFNVAGAYSRHQTGGFRFRISLRASGSRSSTFRWSGSFAASVVVRRHGRRFDTCRLSGTSWQATIPQASLVMTSDPGEYIGGGKSFAYGTPNDSVSATGNRGTVSISMGGWSLDFAAPKGGSLSPGRYVGATRYGFNGSAPGLSITGYGKACNMVTGEFTVRASYFDRRGRLSAIAIDFEQHCEGGTRALRGSVSYSP